MKPTWTARTCAKRASSGQVKAAQNWDSARYDPEFRQMLDQDETPHDTPAATNRAGA
jgi:hypothetical protein